MRATQTYTLVAVAILLLPGSGLAQVTPIAVGQLAPDALMQDFNSGMDGPIGPTDPLFTSIGVTNVRLVGTFVPGDDNDTTFGNALASRSNILTIAAPTSAIDNPGAGGGSGWHFDLAAGTATQAAFCVIDEGGAGVLIAVYFGGMQLGTSSFSSTAYQMKYFESAVPFDAFEIRASGSAGGWCIDNLTVAGFMTPATPSCTLVAPATGAMLSGAVSVLYDADHTTGAAVDASFDFSTDGGTTWSACTAAPGSSNPRLAIPTPATSLAFDWDSVADGVGVAAPQLADLRITVASGVPTATCDVAGIQIDNSSLCSGLCGDCNLNLSGPDILDALSGAQFAAGLAVPTMAQLGCCDVNSSGVIEVLDALLMAQGAAGLGVTLTCP